MNLAILGVGACPHKPDISEECWHTALYAQLKSNLYIAVKGAPPEKDARLLVWRRSQARGWSGTASPWPSEPGQMGLTCLVFAYNLEATMTLIVSMSC